MIHTLGLEEEVVVALDGDDIMVDLGDDGDNDDGDDGDASTSQGTARRPVVMTGAKVMGTFETELSVKSGLLREFCAA